MGKTLNTLIFILLAYILPLAGRPKLLLDPRMAILIGAALMVFLTQPGLGWKEARQESHRDRYSVWLILACSVFAAAIPVIEWAYWRPARHSTVACFAGLFMILSGIGARLWAIRTLGPLFTPTVQVREKHQLVREGPYRLVRHPAYLGAFLATLGCAVVLESWMGMALAGLLMLLAYHIRIQAEEKALISVFGEQYLAFQREAKKMIPFLW